ncbi:MAG: hypothetical protein WCX79_00490 [Candidatus Paceibacterota bacterium]|jgi:hypothetical protein
MKTGTKSLLWGVHQIFWHPLTVTLAWKELYKSWPSWKEFVCIFIHDLGYWGCPNMDGTEGENHPVWAASFAAKYLDTKTDTEWRHYRNLCLYHSRHFARARNTIPSKLCWADKLCYKYDPVWFYTLRAKLSGEIKEYRALPQSQNFKGSDSDWYREQRKLYIKLALSQKADTIPYQDVKN